MSQNQVPAISGAQADAFSIIERHRAQADVVDMRTLGPASHPTGGGGSTVQLKINEPQAPSAMNLQSLAGQFSEGLQHGFYAPDVNRLMDRLVQSKNPQSGITQGDVTVELLNVQAKIGIADAFSKVSSKLSDGLQTMVVKQG